MRDFHIIGLTGQSGAGKTTVCGFLEENGFFIINTDKLARDILSKNAIQLKQLAVFFGDSIIDHDGNANRKEIARIAFSNSKMGKILNETTHPPVFSKVFDIVNKQRQLGNKLFAIDAPLLFESNGDVLCDSTVAVLADENIRIERIINRDKITENEARLRLKAQQDDQYYKVKSDFVINTSNGADSIATQVKEILADLGLGGD